MSSEHHFKWEWDFKSPPEAMWPCIADTNRFNADAGIPGVKRAAKNGTSGNTERLTMTVAGMTMEWDEAPFEWTAPHKFGVLRKYRAGPMEQIRVEAELTPKEGGGSHLVYQIWMTPRGLLAKWLIPLQMKWKSAPTFDQVFRKYDEFASRGAPARLAPARVVFAPSGQARLEQARQALADLGKDEALVVRLTELVSTADDLTLMKIRPYEMADEWKAPRRKVLDLFLHGVRAGMLDFRWDMLCPLCRGAKESSGSLSGVKQQVHCDSCNIDYDVNFERNVELTFRPNGSIRSSDLQEFCVGGPRVTPHVVAQQVLAPGASKTLPLAFGAGSHRVRAKREAGGQLFKVAEGGEGEVTFRLGAKWPEGEPVVAPKATVHLENLTKKDQVFVLERTAWTDTAATAAEVTAMQVFRDLFAKEALRPGEQFSVGSMTVLFTDLLESTRMYREIGDAKAFGLVMNHFDVLKKRIEEEEGALVKTIGDAVLAVFRRPAGAVKAVLRASQELARPGEGRSPLLLKAGIHMGPCIAVTLNDRLDYFGSTVNIAARLVGLSSGGDLVLSSETKADPEVAEYLDSCGYDTENIHAALKGFDQTRFELLRIVPRWAQPAKKESSQMKTQRF